MMKRPANYLILILFFSFIALGRLYLVPPEDIRIAGRALAAEVILLTLSYSVAAIMNIRVLIPRLLLRNRLVEYALALTAWIAGFIIVEIGFEQLLITGYHLTPRQDWYFSGSRLSLLLSIISSTTAYSISIFGTAIIFFLYLWKQSGIRMHNMEEQNARSELEKVRTRIDSEALFSALDQAADRVKQAPDEVVSMLMNLSKSLRTQLYESHHKQLPLSSPPVQTFNLWSPMLNILTAKRYRLLRHGLLIGWFMGIVSFDYDNHSLLLELFLPLFTYLGLVYFNAYVLVPKWLMKDKVSAYLMGVALSIFIVALPSLLFYFHAGGLNGHVSNWSLILFSIGNVIKLSLPVLGVTVLLLFRYWVQNERRIIELQTATLLSELEQLQNQVNPHFLFNMLNNIIVLTKKNPSEAADVLRKLSDMLKYQFRSFTKRSIRLGDDIHFLTDYLNLEKLRRDNFEFNITIDNGVEEILLPSLLFIPFVENAVKHNNDNKTLSFVRIRFTQENDKLHFVCVNSKPLRPTHKEEVGGLGLPNIRRRLNLLYDNRHQLEITENELTYTVQLIIEYKIKKHELYYC